MNVSTAARERGDELTERAEGRVVVAMSGGVDSSVVAALLHEEGHDVVGISMRLYAEPAAAGKSCCSPDDLLDAREVAAERGFPFYVANYQEAFRERVIDYFVDEYRRGRTPSPCVLCNDHLKFDILLQRMVALGAESLATGHYARVERRDDGRLALLRGVDRSKDQSYFLFGLRRPDLHRVRFPLGGMTKDEVRAHGRRLGLPTAEKAESQDICFVGGGDYSAFVEARLAADEIRRGRIVRESSGEVLGEHDGIHKYTVGQRRGLGVAYSEPLFVKGVDPETGDLLVGTREELGFSGFEARNCNWLRWETPPESFRAKVQVRYRHRPVSATVTAARGGEGVHVALDAPERAVSPGQAAVFYEGDEVLGGGWIERAVADG